MNITQALLKIEQLELDKVYLRKHIDDLQHRLDLALEMIEEQENNATFWREMVSDISAELFDARLKKPENTSEDWDETRIDRIGQNGNTGEHYRDFLK